LLVASTFFITVGAALAHAHYDHSTPSIGQVLAASPQRVDIYTDSEMRKAAGANDIAVTAADGSRVDDGNTVVDDANRQHFSIGLRPNLPAGRYVVAFKTLSDVDGDTDSGKFSFYVGVGPTDAQKQLDATLNGQAVPEPAQQATNSSPRLVLFGAGSALIVLLLGLAAFVIYRSRRNNAPN
jgi:methionine-rich copper-binding protein CopC